MLRVVLMIDPLRIVGLLSALDRGMSSYLDRVLFYGPINSTNNSIIIYSVP